MESFQTHIHTGRRIVLPASFCRAKNLKVGDPIIIEADDNAIHVRPLDSIVDDLQDFCAKFKRGGESVVEEFLKERREEAMRE